MTPRSLLRGALNTARGLWILSRDVWRIALEDINLRSELAARDRAAAEREAGR